MYGALNDLTITKMNGNDIEFIISKWLLGNKSIEGPKDTSKLSNFD